MQSKKYSAAEFPTDEEIDVAAAKAGPGIFGVSFANWGKLAAALLALYFFLALLYWGLLEAAIEIRGDDWLELPNRFFGSFSKVERQLTDINGEPVKLPVEGLDLRTAALHEVNYPDSCKADGDLLSCGGKGSSEEEARLWSIFPWIAENTEIERCKDQRFTTLVNVKEAFELRFGVDGELAPGVCVNSVAKKVPTATSV